MENGSRLPSGPCLGPPMFLSHSTLHLHLRGVDPDPATWKAASQALWTANQYLQGIALFRELMLPGV